MTVTELVVKIGADLSDFNRGMDGVYSKMTSTGEALKGFGTKMSMFVTAPLVGLGAGMIKMASDAEEMQSKFNVVFASTGSGVTGALNSFGKSVGRSRVELMGMAAQLGDTLKPMGFTEEAAAGLSVDLVKLATDLSSFNNMPMDEALARLQGTLIGSHENAVRFGVIINENTLKAELARMGLDNLTGSQLEQAKVQARINLLMQGTTDAQGDALRTSESFANQVRGLMASLSDLGKELGDKLLPYATIFIQKLQGLVSWVSNLSETQKEWALIIGVAVAAIGPLAAVLGVVLTMIPSMVAGFGLISGALATMSASGGPIFLTIAAVAAVGAGIYALWDNWAAVTDWMQESWLKVKLIIISGVVSILESLAGFTAFIPGLGDTVSTLAATMRSKMGESVQAFVLFKEEQEATRKATEEKIKTDEAAARASTMLAQATATASVAFGEQTPKVEAATESAFKYGNAVEGLEKVTAMGAESTKVITDETGRFGSEVLRTTTAVEDLNGVQEAAVVVSRSWKEALSDFGGGFMSAISGFEDIFGKIGGKFGEMLSFVDKLTNQLLPGLGKMFDGIGKILGGIGIDLDGIISKAGQALGITSGGGSSSGATGAAGAGGAGSLAALGPAAVAALFVKVGFDLFGEGRQYTEEELQAVRDAVTASGGAGFIPGGVDLSGATGLDWSYLQGGFGGVADTGMGGRVQNITINLDGQTIANAQMPYLEREIEINTR